MVNYTSPLTEGLVLLASGGYLVAIYFAHKLWTEAKGERYWAFYVISAIALGLHEWIVIPVDYHLLSRDTGLLVAEASSIVGALSFAYASYGLYNAMKRIRERMRSSSQSR